MKKSYRGSCHCGAVKYTASVDLVGHTAKCNCHFCAKTRNWGARMEPKDFALLTGEEQLGDYAKI